MANGDLQGPKHRELCQAIGEGGFNEADWEVILLESARLCRSRTPSGPADTLDQVLTCPFGGRWWIIGNKLNFGCQESTVFMPRLSCRIATRRPVWRRSDAALLLGLPE